MTIGSCTPVWFRRFALCKYMWKRAQGDYFCHVIVDNDKPEENERMKQRKSNASDVARLTDSSMHNDGCMRKAL